MPEPPRLFEPRWSREIISETARTLKDKLNWPSALVVSLESELRAHFADAWVSDYEPLVDAVRNEPKDRHVLAASVHSGASVIVTFNLRHFRPEHLQPWGVAAVHPDRFLVALHTREPELVRAKLEQQAKDRRRSLAQLLEILRATVPEFTALVSEQRT